MNNGFKPHPNSLLGKLGSPSYLRGEAMANLPREKSSIVLNNRSAA